MSGKAKIVSIVVAVVVLVGIIVWRVTAPSAVERQLRAYRTDPEAVNVMFPALCDRRYLPAIYDAFEAHGNAPDVAKFRAAVVAELLCVRRKPGAVTDEDNWYSDLAADPRMFSTIIRAYNQEPDPEIRKEMLLPLSGVDFRARFAIYAGLASGPHGLPHGDDSVPGIDPFRQREHRPADYAKINAEWCSVVRPVILPKLAHHGSSYERSTLILTLGEARCNASDVATLQKLASPAFGGDAVEALETLIAISDTVATAQTTLMPLLQGDCKHQDEVIIRFQAIHALKADVAAAIVTAAYACLQASQCNGLDQAACVTRVAPFMTRQE
jgi:hypothetical protein